MDEQALDAVQKAMAGPTPPLTYYPPLTFPAHPQPCPYCGRCPHCGHVTTPWPGGPSIIGNTSEGAAHG